MTYWLLLAGRVEVGTLQWSKMLAAEDLRGRTSYAM